MTMLLILKFSLLQSCIFHHLSFNDSLNSVLSGSVKQIMDMKGRVSLFISVVHIEKKLFPSRLRRKNI